MTTTADIKQILIQCAAGDCTGCPYRSTGCVISLIEDVRVRDNNISISNDSNDEEA